MSDPGDPQVPPVTYTQVNMAICNPDGFLP